MDKYIRVKFLLEALLKRIEIKGKGEIDYQINAVKKGIHLINDFLVNNSKDTTIDFELKRLIRNLYPPRGGLSDFYIWKDDEDERIKVNTELSDIGNELWRTIVNELD